MSRDKIYHVRPHHLLCTLAFEGKGYHSAFIENFQQYVDNLNQNPQTLLQITSHTDVICSACPHQRGLLCQSEDKVQLLDKRHSSMLRLQAGDRLTWQAAKVRLAEKAPDDLDELCAGCEWQPLGICVNALRKLRQINEQ